MQRLRPNIQKAAERKEILTPQEKRIEKNKDESCVDREQNDSCVVVSMLILITFIKQVYKP